MVTLQERLAEQIPALRDELKSIVAEYGDKVVSEVTVKQVYGGMRGVLGLLGDTSSVAPEEGLIVRGTPVKDLTSRTAEEILYLLLTGEFPGEDALNHLHTELNNRADVPAYVWNTIDAMEPESHHSMALFNTAILSMQRESVFAHKYEEGMGKADFWQPALEDCLNIIARLPAVAAYVYRKRFGKGDRIPRDPNLNWSENFAHMLGIDDPNGEFKKLIQLYMVLHCDHGSGNVSAFSALTVGSALSDLYYSLSAGLNGLAGPLHGLANQECLRWVLKVQERFGGIPSDKELEDFVWETLNQGNVVPGYGHAVLRVTDPRFEAFLEFGKTYCPEAPVFKLVAKMFEVIPMVLQQVEKISNPWPNVDAASGSLLYHYGLKEFPYYTVLFGVSRALGICSQNVLARALGLPIIRPKAVSMKKLKELAQQA